MENKEREEEVIRIPENPWISFDEWKKRNEFMGRGNIHQGIDAKIQSQQKTGNVIRFGEGRNKVKE